MRQLRALTFLFFYGLPDEAGRNPNWEAIGYPGALSPAPSPEQAPKTISVENIAGDTATLQADVCVVGSGARGGVIAEHGRAATRWGFDDELDARLFRRAMVELAKLQRAAGAKEIITFYQHPPLQWREGEDFDAFLAAIEQGSLAANDVAAFTAHQMGSCRMGSDPAESVADGRGELHDTGGVWIGDASAFPSAPASTR